MSERFKAVCSGSLFGGLVDCYVLEDGRRVISQRGAVRALTGASDATNPKAIGVYLARLPKQYQDLSSRPVVEFTMPTGGVASGREAQWFVDVLRAYKAAWRAGELRKDQEHLAENADRILDALAGVAIVALIDEATGYDAHREKGALGRLFDRIFRRTPAPWERMFQDSLIVALCKLDGIEWSGGRHPRHLGSTQEKIYLTIFGTEAGRELQRRNPSPSHGKNHHQTLALEVQTYLRGQLEIVEVIAKQSRDKPDFWHRMDRQYGGGFLQLELDPEAP